MMLVKVMMLMMNQQCDDDDDDDDLYFLKARNRFNFDLNSFDLISNKLLSQCNFKYTSG